MSFVLDPRLAADTLALPDLPICALRLMRDSRYPWLILVPRRTGMIELIDLSPAERHGVMDEIALASEALKAETGCLKLNVAAIGNMVRQLHIHVVARVEGDDAWPGPVWGKHPALPYPPGEAERLAKALASRLAGW